MGIMKFMRTKKNNKLNKTKTLTIIFIAITSIILIVILLAIKMRNKPPSSSPSSSKDDTSFKRTEEDFLRYKKYCIEEYRSDYKSLSNSLRTASSPSNSELESRHDFIQFFFPM